VNVGGTKSIKGKINRHKINGMYNINFLNAELNPIRHLLALLGAHPIFYVSRIRVKMYTEDVR
jgi:hypothetical protein